MKIPRAITCVMVLGLCTAGMAQDKNAAKPKAGEQQTIVGCLTGYDGHYTIGTSSDALYLLEGENENFKQFNAKLVRATGTVTEPAPGTSKHNVLSQQPPTMKVTALKKVADGCN